MIGFPGLVVALFATAAATTPLPPLHPLSLGRPTCEDVLAVFQQSDEWSLYYTWDANPRCDVTIEYRSPITGTPEACAALRRWTHPPERLPIPSRLDPQPAVITGWILEADHGDSRAEIWFDFTGREISYRSNDRFVERIPMLASPESVLVVLGELGGGREQRDALQRQILARDPDAPRRLPRSSSLGIYAYVEELPVPVVRRRPQYPRLARERGVHGTVSVDVLVGADGMVHRARVLRSIPELDAAALAAVRQWQFRPALSHNRPVQSWVQVPIEFPGE